MKIAVLMNDFSGTGVPRVTLRLTEGLIARGHEVELVVLNPKGPMRNQVPTSAKVEELNVSRAITATPKIIRYLKKSKPVTIIAAEDQLGIIAAFSCLVIRSNAKILVTSHVPYSKTNLAKGLKGKIFVSALKLLWRRIDVFTTVSAGLADDMAAETGIPREEIKVLHNAVIQEENIARNPNRDLHPFFSSGDKVLLAMGSLHRRKGFHDLVEVMRLLKDKASLRLIILGEGRERANLQQKIDDAGLKDKVDLAGYSDDPFGYLQTADLFVLPSYFEGLPTVLIEALSCGCPVIATDCIAGPKEILAGGEFGRLVPVGGTREMAAAISEVILENPDHEKLFQRARAFTQDNIAYEAEQMLVGVISE